MRYIELFENEQIINQLIKNPKFINWFKGSKVVDSNGRPELVFHYSTAEDHFDRFNSLSHFGTNKAAEERFEYFYDEDDTGTQVGFTVPCFLNIKKPMYIEDLQAGANMLAFDSYISNQISLKELYYVSNDYLKEKIKNIKKEFGDDITTDDLDDSIDDSDTNKIDFIDSKLIKVLESKGYDGFCYVNQVEDEGSMSWVIFHSNQVWRLFSNKED